MPNVRKTRFWLQLLLFWGIGCNKEPASVPKATEVPKSAAKQSVSAAQPVAKQFGFQVLSVEKELCCSDSPGKPRPTGGFAVEGVTPDNWRFLLSCFGDSRFVYDSRASRDVYKQHATRDEWFAMHTASLESQDGYDSLTIYIFEPKGHDAKVDWQQFARCTVVTRLDRANDVSPIRVVASEERNLQKGLGYEVRAVGEREMYQLSCTEGAQAPCTSIAPGYYRGVRDQSELRVCDGSLKVLGTYRIAAERAR